jgi:4-diphosphocytidyl-2-C-methyl-D-erythritol kinase
MAERAARVTAQAKLNLLLHVGGVRPSGFHDICTLFQLIELGDDVLVRTFTARERSIESRGMEELPAEQNLAYRAAVMYAEATGWPNGFSIEIDKRVPVGSGLGGGSADAAAVLRILNFLAPRPTPYEVIVDLAARLGSDVAFFASAVSRALGEGRGERLQRMAPLPVRGITMLRPAFPVNTKDAYTWIDEARRSSGRAAAQLPQLPQFGPADLATWDQVVSHAVNDFEPVVCARYPALASLLEALRGAGYVMAGMSGSGSTVFAVSALPEPSRATPSVAPGVRQMLTRTAATPAAVELTED